jgi:hypothetical protein
MRRIFFGHCGNLGNTVALHQGELERLIESHLFSNQDGPKRRGVLQLGRSPGMGERLVVGQRYLTSGEGPPAALPVTVEKLREEPDEYGERSRANLDFVTIPRRCGSFGLDGYPMVPGGDQRAVSGVSKLFRPFGAVAQVNRRNNPLSAKWNEAEQSHPNQHTL